MFWGIANIWALSVAAAVAKSLQSCLTLCDPIDGSPPRLPCPWDSPGKNTRVGCHFLLQCMKVKSESEVAQSLLQDNLAQTDTLGRKQGNNSNLRFIKTEVFSSLFTNTYTILKTMPSC